MGDSATGQRRAASAPVGLAVIAALGVALAGCGTSSGAPPDGAPPRSASTTPAPSRLTPHPTPRISRGVTFARATAVHQRYGDTIRQRYPGVQGTGVGVVVFRAKFPRPQDPAYGIIVFVDRADHLPRSAQSIAGVPLRFQVSGHIVLH